ncbi:MAG: hypothetical protein R3A52_14320 [Polyangiales bacterium]
MTSSARWPEITSSARAVSESGHSASGASTSPSPGSTHGPSVRDTTRRQSSAVSSSGDASAPHGVRHIRAARSLRTTGSRAEGFRARPRHDQRAGALAGVVPAVGHVGGEDREVVTHRRERRVERGHRRGGERVEVVGEHRGLDAPATHHGVTETHALHREAHRAVDEHLDARHVGPRGDGRVERHALAPAVLRDLGDRAERAELRGVDLGLAREGREREAIVGAGGAARELVVRRGA